jgi:ribosomal protein S18 acetylase RimI-like enzyme
VKISKIDFELVDDATEIFKRFFETNVRSRNKKVIVAEEDGKIIGYMMGAIERRPPVFKITHRAFITDAGVTARRRNLGIGTKLFNAFSSWAKEKGMKFISLAVVYKNEIGIEFWKKQGFETMLLLQRKML